MEKWSTSSFIRKLIVLIINNLKNNTKNNSKKICVCRKFIRILHRKSK
nr:MAG TPA: hypothetical protein [Bacteriophage sp.]